VSRSQPPLLAIPEDAGPDADGALTLQIAVLLDDAAPVSVQEVDAPVSRGLDVEVELMAEAA
jgi:hypothetical protein